MDVDALTRRRLLKTTAKLAVVAAAPLVVGGCTKEEFSCEDASGLAEADAKLRNELGYQDRSPHGESKSCANCAFFVAGRKDQCGQCTLVKGPIHPEGYCASWAIKT